MELPLPLWGVITISIVFVLMLLIQPHLKKSPNFTILNELLCSFVWLVWDLELRAFAYFSKTALLTVFFVRQLFSPYFFEGALGNTSEAFFYCYGKRKNVLQLLYYIGAHMTAVIAAVLWSTVVWNSLASTISEGHREFLKADVGYIFTVSPLEAFLTELVLMVLYFLPRLFIKPSFLLYLAQSILLTLILAKFSDVTGAFMNPKSATAYVLFWHMQDPISYHDYFLVYWIGALIGTVIALGLDHQLQRSRGTEHRE